MNSSVTARKDNILFFFLAVLVTIILAFGTGFFLKKNLSGERNGVTESTRSCLTTMRANGFNPILSGKSISVTLATMVNVETLVYKSGVIISNCPAYALTEFCAGAGCQTPGVSFTLQQKDQ